MQLPFADVLTNILGIQSLTGQFGAKQASPGTESDHDQFNHGQILPDDLGCEFFAQTLPSAFAVGAASASVVYVRENLAVVPEHWGGRSVGSSWLNLQSSDASLKGCLKSFKQANFIAFDEAFFEFLGQKPTFEIAHSFPPEERGSVHEAPVYVAETSELVFADTSVEGWLYALNVESYAIRKLSTKPPLPNVNGGTRNGKNMYLTTNGSPTPGVWNCSLPSPVVDLSGHGIGGREEMTCTPVVNNYRLAHLNAPNDLIFTSRGHILFTDPNYGWAQDWPGVGPPELSTAVYHFNTTSRALVTLINSDVLEPNGLALSKDEKTLYVADSNSTSGKPIGVWESSVRNVYAFDIDVDVPRLSNRRLVHVVEAGWPDGLRITKDGLLLVASMGGVDVVDVSRGGVLLGKINVGDDVVFNLEPIGEGSGVWMLTGKKAVYKVTIAG